MMLSCVVEPELNFVFLSCKTNVLKILTKANGIWKNWVYVVWIVNHYIKVNILTDIFVKADLYCDWQWYK